MKKHCILSYDKTLYSSFYLNSKAKTSINVSDVDPNPAGNTKIDKNVVKELDFKDIKSPVRIRDIYKIEQKLSLVISVFGYENKVKYPIYVSKNVVKINMLICY